MEEQETVEEPAAKISRIQPKLVVPEGISKKQYKKQLKTERYNEKKLVRRAEEKLKRKEKKAKLKAEGRGNELAGRRKHNKMANSTSKYFDKTSEQWDVHLRSEPLEQVFNPSEIVYLTADSENVITELDDTKVYVIGGIIDHNSHKNLCYNLALEKGFSHARLPIGEHIKMNSRKVLTINHVFEILVRKTEGLSWADCLLKVLPQRKSAKLKEDGTEEPDVDEEAEPPVDDDRPDVEPSDVEPSTKDEVAAGGDANVGQPS
ncbi:unnamed protein product, partial [Mesorhabditis spiculigera]